MIVRRFTVYNSLEWNYGKSSVESLRWLYMPPLEYVVSDVVRTSLMVNTMWIEGRYI